MSIGDPITSTRVGMGIKGHIKRYTMNRLNLRLLTTPKFYGQYASRVVIYNNRLYIRLATVEIKRNNRSFSVAQFNIF